MPDLARIATSPAPPAAAAALTVGITGVTVRGDVPDWMRDNTRDGLNTTLSKVQRLRVLSREKIDFVRDRRGLSEIEVAEALGIQKMISGSLMMVGTEMVLEARVVDTSTGILDASEAVRGHPDELIDLQNDMAAALLGALGVRLSAQERDQLFARRTKDTLDAYRRLTDTFGEAAEGPASPPSAGERTSWLAWPRAANAQTTGDAEPAILALLEAYRTALEREDVDAVAATHVEFDAQQRTGFERYFEGAEDLHVTVEDVEVLVEGDEALVTFTRRDAFRDQKSGKPLELEVRLSSEVLRKDDRWLLRGVKRS
jgi:TolB-like protein/ketosteroid isomerase-like protein